MKKQAIEKLLAAHNKGQQFPVDYDSFITRCKSYISATKQGRLMCNIEKVSASGMSRTMRFFELAKYTDRNEYCQLNFWTLFKVLGYRQARNSDGFLINGCGMDMVFATHYNVIHDMQRLGFITRKTCDTLAQKTPHKV